MLSVKLEMTPQEYCLPLPVESCKVKWVEFPFIRFWGDVKIASTPMNETSIRRHSGSGRALELCELRSAFPYHGIPKT